jgi:ABC-type molybdate transport system substrate-binding protein
MVASPRIERLHERVEGNQSMYRPRKAIIRNAFGLLILIANFMVPSSTARADEPYALVTIGMHRVFDRVMPAFEAASGRRFRIEYASTIEIAQRIIGGERADFVVASRAGIDRLISAQKVIEGNDFDLGGSAIVIAVPKGRRAPDISSVEGMKNALLAAKTVSYTDPASGGPSGVHLARVLDRLGIFRPGKREDPVSSGRRTGWRHSCSGRGRPRHSAVRRVDFLSWSRRGGPATSRNANRYGLLGRHSEGVGQSRCRQISCEFSAVA